MVAANLPPQPGRRGAALALVVMILSERQSLKAELAEIPRQVAAYWNELENGSPRRTRREQLEWMIQERERRLTDVRARLRAIKHES
jgi:hypothetical protein